MRPLLLAYSYEGLTVRDIKKECAITYVPFENIASSTPLNALAEFEDN
jgi:hypothetical protein